MRFVIGIGMFVIGLVLGAAIVQEVGGRLWPPFIEKRFSYYSAHRADFDTVHIGTSRFWRHIDPIEFDARMSENGHSINSINLSAGTLDADEVEALISEIISERPRPSLLIVETLRNVPTERSRERKKGTDRFIWWRSVSNLPRQVLSTLHSNRSHGEKIAKFFDDARWTLVREFRIGKGPAIFRNLLQVGPVAEPELEGLGFEPLTAEEIGVSEFEQRKKIRRFFSTRLTPKHRLMNLSGSSEDHQAFRRRILKLLPPDDVAVIFVAPAGSKHHYDSPRAKIPALFLNDYKEYPDLYRIEKWVDLMHLNPEGAREFTVLLADAVSEELDRRRQ